MTTQKRRIVFVWNYLGWGGAQIYFLAIIKRARPKWDVLAILPRGSTNEITRYLEDLGVEIELVDYKLITDPAPTVRQKITRQLNRIKVEYNTFRKLLRYNVRDTVFHVEIAPWQSMVFLTAMSLRRARVFITLHNFLPDAPLWRTLLWKARFWWVSYLPGIRFFASNNDTKNRLRGWVNERFWNRIRVTFTAVDPPQIEAAATAPFDRDEVRRAIGIGANSFVVLTVGNFIDRKGRWVLLDAAREVTRQNEDVSFVWLTPQAPAPEDQKRIDDAGLGDRFKLVLSKSLGGARIDVLKFFRIADVFALPSYVEGLPIALLEAMSLEVASISTNVYAIPEAVKDRETGILIEVGDAKALADAVLTLRKDADLRLRLARNGRQHVLRSFDERDAAASVIDAYEEALDER